MNDTREDYLPRIDDDDAALVFEIAAKVGFDIIVKTEPQAGQWGISNDVRTRPGRNTEIILYAGNTETGLDSPQAQVCLVLDVLNRYVDREYRDQIKARIYRDDTPITWTKSLTPKIVATEEFLRGQGVRVSEEALNGATDFFAGLHLLAREQGKELNVHDAALIVLPAVAWKALALRESEVLTFTVTEVVRHKVDLSYVELDRRLPGWEHYLQGRIDIKDAPAWREAITTLAGDWVGEDSQRQRHLIVDDVDVRDYDREDSKPFWVPYYC